MVRQALYAAKICSYSQGMNIIRAKSIEKGWNINMGSLARIWKVQILLHVCCASMNSTYALWQWRLPEGVDSTRIAWYKMLDRG